MQTLYYNPPTMANHFGQIIRRHRKALATKLKKTITQEGLANMIGMSRAQVQVLEQSPTWKPMYDSTLLRLAKVFDTTPEAIRKEYGDDVMKVTLTLPSALYKRVVELVGRKTEDVDKFIEKSIEMYLKQLGGRSAAKPDSDDDDFDGGSSMRIGPKPSPRPGRLSPGKQADRKAAKEQPRDVEDD